MVTRQYDAPEFQLRDTRVFKQPQVAAADTRAVTPLIAGDGDWKDRLLQTFGGTVMKALDKSIDIELQDAYLEGQAAAGVVESEAELQGNLLTRDWKVAGYRDTMGKLALADAEAKFALDLKELRQKDPEELQNYLTKRRGELTPMLNSMSREARAAAAGQLLLQDRAATKAYTTERYKFIVEQKSQAVHTQNAVSMRNMHVAQTQYALGDMPREDYLEQIRKTAGTMVQSVWADSSLPREIKQQLSTEILQSALANDSVDLYDYLAANPIGDHEGTTIVARLSGEQQVKVANAYRGARERAKDAYNLSAAAEISKLEAQIDTKTYDGDVDMLDKQLRPMVVAKQITLEKYTSLRSKFLEQQYTGEQDSSLAEMYIRGDRNAILNAGSSETDAAKAVEKRLARAGVAPEQRLSLYLAAGMNGMPSGFKSAGEMLSTALRQARSPDGTALPQNLRIVENVGDVLLRARQAGQSDAQVALLSGLPEKDRVFASQVFSRAMSGASYDEAIAKATEMELADSKLTPAVRVAQSTQTANKAAEEIRKLDSRGIISSVWVGAKAAFSSEAAADSVLRPKSMMTFKDGVFSDGPTVQFYAEQVRAAIGTRAEELLSLRPSLSPDEVVSAAKADVAASTISTRYGPIPLPVGTRLETVFGIGESNVNLVGPALNEMLHETKPDANWQIAFTNGRMFAQEFDREGNRVGTGKFIEPTLIRSKVEELNKRRQGKAEEIFGLGRTVQSGDVSLKYNGLNTAGVPATWMMRFRNNLVANEGVRGTAYDDETGKPVPAGQKPKGRLTVGVGVAEGSPYFPKLKADGTVDPKDLHDSYANASNAAAVVGARLARESGRNNEHMFALMSELAYHSGTSFMSQTNRVGERYREFSAALRGTDVAAAQQAFTRTAAWYASRDRDDPKKVSKRQTHYLALIKQAMTGE